MKGNPRRKPATQADVKKAWNDGCDKGLTYAIAIMMTVLCDKENYDTNGIQRVWKELNDLSDSVAKKYVKIQDLIDTLEQERNIHLSGGLKK